MPGCRILSRFHRHTHTYTCVHKRMRDWNHGKM